MILWAFSFHFDEQTGYASYYAHKFKGRKTASGERYQPQLMTAAHRSLPFGTIVIVKNLNSDDSVLVKINDRGPYIKGRIIDLSYAAADSLGLIKAGKLMVQLKITEDYQWVDDMIIAKPNIDQDTTLLQLDTASSE